MKKTTTKTEPQSLTIVDIVTELVDPGESVLPRLLPIAAARARAVLSEGLTDASVETHVEYVAAKGFENHVGAAKQLDDWMCSGVGSTVTDPVDGVISDTRDAAFALGLALGLQIGGAR